mmetsp:Transcript_39150/g.86067  ORF Transcript_39150/g.86067 Transcript_39150/m.86067 type:complete len:225 (-) Transcript_39150:1503-2177(-)
MDVAISTGDAPFEKATSITACCCNSCRCSVTVPLIRQMTPPKPRARSVCAISEPKQRLSSTMRCWSISTTSTGRHSPSGTCVRSVVFRPSATSTKLSTSSTVAPSEAERLMSASRKSENRSSCSWRQTLLSSRPRQTKKSSTLRESAGHAKREIASALLVSDALNAEGSCVWSASYAPPRRVPESSCSSFQKTGNSSSASLFSSSVADSSPKPRQTTPSTGIRR